MKTDSIRLYDLGVDVKKYDRETLKSLAWPVASWECIVPDSIDPVGINILVKMILSFIDKGIFTRTEEITHFLISDLKLNADFVKSVIEDCESQYFNKNFKKYIKLKDDATKMLRSAEGQMSLDENVSDVVHKVYLFQDCITKAVVPCFNIKALPDDYESTEVLKDSIRPAWNYDNFKQPRIYDIDNGLKLWSKICQRSDSDYSEIAILENNDHETEPTIEVLEENAQMDELQKVSAITVLSDKPEFLYLRGYLRFNYDYPDELIIHSPWGAAYDTWFEKIVRRSRGIDEQFRNQLNNLVLEKKEYFKDKIAIGDDRNYPLLVQYPEFFCKDNHLAVKIAVRSMYDDFDQFKIGKKNSNDIRSHLREATEKFLKATKDENRWLITETKVENLVQLRAIIKALCRKNNIQLEGKEINIYDKLFDNYKNNYKPDQGNTKDILMRFLVYAYRFPESDIYNLFAKEPSLFSKCVEYAQVGNESLHSTKVSKEFTLEEVKNNIVYYEHIFKSFYTCFYNGAK